MFSGTDLELHQEMTYYDDRIKLNKASGNRIDKYNIKSKRITNEEEWQKVI